MQTEKGKDENLQTLILRLYVFDHSPSSVVALENIQVICEKLKKKFKVELSIIDVLENPEEAEKEGILAIPTLVKLSPPPVQRLIGDLSDTQLVLEALSS